MEAKELNFNGFKMNGFLGLFILSCCRHLFSSALSHVFRQRL